MKKIILVVLVGLLAGCSQPVQVTVTPKSVAKNSFLTNVVEEQTIVSEQKPGNTVTINSVTLADDSFIVVRLSTNGQLGPVVGVSKFLSKGSQANISVTLDKTYPAQTRLAAYIHKDNGDKKFTATQDFPILDEQTKPVKMEFTFVE